MSRLITFRVNISNESEFYDFRVNVDNTWEQFNRELIIFIYSIYKVPNINSKELIITHTLGPGIQITLSDVLYPIIIRDLILMGILKDQFDDIYIFDVDTWKLEERKELMLIHEAEERTQLYQDSNTNYVLKIILRNGKPLNLLVNDNFTIDDILDRLYETEGIERTIVKFVTRSGILDDISLTLGQLKGIGELNKINPTLNLELKIRGSGYSAKY